MARAVIVQSENPRPVSPKTGETRAGYPRQEDLKERLASPRREGAERLWRGRGGGNRQGPSRRHVPRRVYPEICRGRVRPSRLPEEIEDRPGNTAPDMELIKQRLREAEQIAKEMKA